MTQEWETVSSTLKYKLPFFVLGVIVGNVIVWIALKWVPGALVAANAIVGG